jgi:hypothetical protein
MQQPHHQQQQQQVTACTLPAPELQYCTMMYNYGFGMSTSSHAALLLSPGGSASPQTCSAGKQQGRQQAMSDHDKVSMNTSNSTIPNMFCWQARSTTDSRQQ